MPRLIAVMYHYVQEPGSIDGIHLHGHTPEQFEQDILILKARFKPAMPEDIVRFFTAPQSVQQDAFVMTFDDGLKDHVHYCGPLLAKHGLVGHFFMPGALLRERQILTVHKRHLLAGRLGEETFQAQLLKLLSETDQDFDLDAVAPIETAVQFFRFGPHDTRQLKYYLSYVMPLDRYARLVDALFQREFDDKDEIFSQLYLSAQDCRTLEALGMEVGGHGYHHDHLARMSDEGQASDIEKVTGVLGEILPKRARSFSYPYGRVQRSFNDLTKALVKEAGFYCAFSNVMGENQTAKDLYAVERIDANYVASRYGG